MADDKEIIREIRENAEQGFRLLMAKYKSPVYWHIRRLVVVHDDAQDVAQETFVRVFRNFSQYNEKNSFRAWIFRIATNEALRLLGQRKGEMMLSLDEKTADMLDMKSDDYFDGSDEVVVKFQRAILQLPAKQQLAFNLRYYDDMSYDEIAVVTGSTAANVKANYHFAKEKIVKYMQTND